MTALHFVFIAALGYSQFGFASAAATAVDLEEMSEGHKSTGTGVYSMNMKNSYGCSLILVFLNVILMY